MESSRSGSSNKVGVIYICGACYRENELQNKEQVRCKECGYRILYVKRPKKVCILDAR